MNLERIVQEKNHENQHKEEPIPINSPLSDGQKVINRITEQENKNIRPSIKIRFPQYERFSMNAFDRFRDNTRLESVAEREDTQIEISPLFAWFLLLMNILANSLIPCWLMSNLSKQPHTRNSWRFFVISILTLPMVAYQKRKIQAVGGNIFNLITSDLIRQNYIIAVNFSIEYWFLIQAVNMTSLTHAVTFISMKFFIISLVKFIKKRQHHQFVKAGLILVIVAISLMISDSVINSHYEQQASASISHSKLMRLGGDILSLIGSCVSAFLYEKYKFPSQPRFLNLFFQNIFICFNYVCFGYYFGGSELSFNEYYGVFGLFDSNNFVTIFYVGIMLGFNLMLSNIMLYEIYSSFILEIANSFVPLVTALLYRILSLELVPAYTYMSFGFFVPGMILILSGENASKGGDVKMDFVVYRPQNAPTYQQTQTKQMQFQLQQWGKSSSMKKISLETSMQKVREQELENQNLSLGNR